MPASWKMVEDPLGRKTAGCRLMVATLVIDHHPTKSRCARVALPSCTLHRAIPLVVVSSRQTLTRQLAQLLVTQRVSCTSAVSALVMMGLEKG